MLIEKYPEWNCDTNRYDRESTVNVKQFTNTNPSELNKFEDKFENLAFILARSLGILRSDKKIFERRTRKSGRINPLYIKDELIQLYSGRDLTERIYDRRTNPLREKYKSSMSLGILLDQSGSTRHPADQDSEYRRIDLIKYATLTIGKSLVNIDDNFFIYSFHTNKSADPTIIEVIKEDNEVYNRTIEQRIAAIEHTGETPDYNNKDGAAIRYVNEKLLQNQYKTKYLFLVTDGNPNCDYTYYQNNTAFQDTLKAMQEGNSKGIQYVYLTINPENNSENFMRIIADTTQYSKRFTKMKDIIEGLTLAYESIKLIT